jgi:hypothetical protein
MSSEFERARARYQAAKSSARRQAALNLMPVFGVEFTVLGYGPRAAQALTDQWAGKHRSRWDWPEIFRRHKDIDRLDMVIWGAHDRLCGLGLALLKSEYVEVRFLEGDPREDSPTKGKIIPIALECTACYAQATGRGEMRIEPANKRLATIYREAYDFTLVTPDKGAAYYSKKV